MTEKRFVLLRSDYDLKYEFRVADISKVEKTKEDFWNEEEEIYDYRKYIAYLWENDAFLTLEEADELLNALHEKNEQLKERNDNQYNQLNELWQLIEAKDWETLTAMDNQMKEYEEQLKREWRCYE